MQRLIDFYNADILPVVFSQGSLGASGDLAPLANLSLPLLGLGEVMRHGHIIPASEALDNMGWRPIDLQSKEGLALLNGTQFMSAHAVSCAKVSARSASIFRFRYSSYIASSIVCIPSFLLVWIIESIWCVFASRIRFLTAIVACITSKAATRPLPFCNGISCWETTASKTLASCMRICCCWCGGKTSITCT